MINIASSSAVTTSLWHNHDIMNVKAFWIVRELD